MKKIIRFEEELPNNSLVTSEFKTGIKYDHLYEINQDNIKSVVKQLNVKYFSINQIINYNFCQPKFKNSIANKTLEFFNKYTGYWIVNSYLKTNFEINIVGDNKQSDKPFSKYFINVNNIEKHLNNHYKSFYKHLLKSKIISSSFFLSEILNLSSISSNFHFSTDIFFDNLNEFKKFAKELKIEHEILKYNENTFENIFNELYEEFNWKPFIPNFYLNINNCFLNKANIYNENGINVNEFYIETINVKIEEKKEREVFLDMENYGDQQFFYLNKVLNLSSKSITSYILQSIYDFFIKNNEITNYFLIKNTKLLEHLKKIKKEAIIINNLIFMDNIPLFFYYSTFNLNKIKMFLREKNIKKAKIFNCKTLEISEISVRSINYRKVLHFSY